MTELSKEYIEQLNIYRQCLSELEFPIVISMLIPYSAFLVNKSDSWSSLSMRLVKK